MSKLSFIREQLDICARRDPKGLYQAALQGRIKDFTGLDSPYEAPQQADCEINTDEVELADAVQHVLAVLFKK
jgi:adenylylsulfate kinase